MWDRKINLLKHVLLKWLDRAIPARYGKYKNCHGLKEKDGW